MSNVLMWLLYGAYIGFASTAAVHIVWTGRDERRAAAARQGRATAALKNSAGDQALADLRLNRLMSRRRQA
ncbi:hypothetical protein ACFWMT_01080 [Streptomyces sp. NPDC058368]|uniref:hypothetical protein n=1 Tax=Streptomyces sp. NPDC058368 TaxID=3346461 RepID=UPI00365B2571